MALLIIMPDRDTTPLVAVLKKLEPELDVRVWPDYGNASDIEFAVSWNHPKGALTKFPNLKVVSSFGAGIDHMMTDTEYPAHIRTVRIVDKDLARDMSQYVLMAILNHQRSWNAYIEDKKLKQWIKREYQRDTTIGILGLGHLGKATALDLKKLELNVIGWSRSKKEIEGVTCLKGDVGLQTLLKQSDYLVCLLPLTPETNGLLNKKLFASCKQGAYLINVSRGDCVVDSDLISALDSTQLSGACMDVFSTEPLPKDHPYWIHPNIMITPHVSSLTNPESAAQQIIINYQNMKSGMNLINLVNFEQGY